MNSKQKFIRDSPKVAVYDFISKEYLIENNLAHSNVYCFIKKHGYFNLEEYRNTQKKSADATYTFDKTELYRHKISSQLAINYYHRFGFTTVQQILDYRNRDKVLKIDNVRFLASDVERSGLARHTLIYYVRCHNCTTIEQIQNTIKSKKHKIKFDNPHSNSKRNFAKKYQSEKNKEFVEKYGVKYTTIASFKRRNGYATIEDALMNYKPSQKHKSNPRVTSEWQKAYFELQTKINNLERLITNPEIREPRISKLRAEFAEIYGEIII